MDTALLVAFVGIGGTLAGAALQALTGVWSARRSEADEYARWIRGQRVTVFVDLLSAGQQLILSLPEQPHKMRSLAFSAYSDAGARLDLFVPADFFQEFQDIWDQLGKLIDDDMTISADNWITFGRHLEAMRTMFRQILLVDRPDRPWRARARR